MKACRKCGVDTPLDGFHKQRSRPDGPHPWCKPCVSAAKTPEQHRRSRLKHRYGLTVEQYDAMFEAQDGRCAICLRPERVGPGGKPRRLAVDHDHRCCPGRESCGACVRKLLCHDCNHGIGALGDDPEILERAAAYVREGSNAIGLFR